MKYLASLLFLGTFFTLIAQEKVVLNHHYVPNQKIEQTTSSAIKSKMKFNGDSEMLVMLEAGGTPTTSTESTLMEMETIVTTGFLDSENCFDIELLFIKAKSNDDEIISTGTKIIGDICENEEPEFYDIVNTTMDPDVKNMTLELISSMFTQMDFNNLILQKDVPLQQEQNLVIPIGFMELEMLITITYTLKSIKNGMANIDFVHKVSGNSEVMDIPFTLSGDGNGKLIYDTKNDITVLYESTIFQNIFMNMDGLKCEINQQVTQKQEFKILK